MDRKALCVVSYQLQVMRMSYRGRLTAASELSWGYHEVTSFSLTIERVGNAECRSNLQLFVCIQMFKQRHPWQIAALAHGYITLK